MKWYLGNIPVLKLGSIFYWNGKKYKVVNTKSKEDNSKNSSATIGVKIVEKNPPNS